MNSVVSGVFASVLWLFPVWGSLLTFADTSSTKPPTAEQLTIAPRAAHYDKSLRFNVYTFTITAADTGAVRELTVKAYRGALLLTNFRVRVDGAVVGAEVADLDQNRFPELYVYSTSSGSGSFGHVYAWHFLPERKAVIVPVNWQLKTDAAYMGHDSLWVERDILCRKYPVYKPGDVNSEPNGGKRMVHYRLKSIGAGFALVAELN